MKRLEKDIEELEKSMLCQTLSEAMSTPEGSQSSVVRVKHDAYSWRFESVQGGNKNEALWQSIVARLDGLSKKTQQAFHRTDGRDFEIWLTPRASSPMQVAEKLGWNALGARLEAVAISGETHSPERESSRRPLAL